MFVAIGLHVVPALVEKVGVPIASPISTSCCCATPEIVLFSKILIANRGEIAIRVMRTAREMGIQSVAVFSEPDARALHVRAADLGVPIGGQTAAESYLNAEKLLAAAQISGADAVHGAPPVRQRATSAWRPDPLA